MDRITERRRRWDLKLQKLRFWPRNFTGVLFSVPSTWFNYIFSHHIILLMQFKPFRFRPLSIPNLPGIAELALVIDAWACASRPLQQIRLLIIALLILTFIKVINVLYRYNFFVQLFCNLCKKNCSVPSFYFSIYKILVVS